MTRYRITYIDPNPKPGADSKRVHELEEASDAHARMRFLNLSWVAFTAITIDTIEPILSKTEKARRKRVALNERNAEAISAAAQAYTDRVADMIDARDAEPQVSTLPAVGGFPIGGEFPPPPPPKAVRAPTRAQQERRLAKLEAEADKLAEAIRAAADEASAAALVGRQRSADALMARIKSTMRRKAALGRQIAVLRYELK